MNDDFYVAFEEKFRGSEELIKERQKKYLKFINPLKILKDEVKALDIGCGRGEWISLLNENGFNARGIDVNESMVKVASQKGLNAAVNDALGELKSLDESSVDIITAFQVVEHIKFDDVLELIKEAKRVLAPCGILILETPNPENIILATHKFYLDASHIKPIPHELLAFATQYNGFERNLVFFTNEHDYLERRDVLEIYDVLGGVSPDYSVIAQKSGDKSDIFDNVFNKTYGINLYQISRRYTESNENNIKTTINDIKDILIAKQNELNSILSSRSWRITKPLRAGKDVVKKIVNLLKQYTKNPKSIIEQKKCSKIYSSTLTKKESEIYDKLKKD